MKVILRDFMDILITLWVAFSEAVQDILELIKTLFGPDNLYILMGDEENPTEISVNRLDEFILEDNQEEQPKEDYQVSSYPLTDALDFDKKPSEAELKRVTRGDRVLLISNGESFWVDVSSGSDGDFEGIVNSTPQDNGYKHGQAIEFAAHHIFQILDTAQAV